MTNTQTRMPACPWWCDEIHGPDEERTRSADHARALVHVLGGPFVALHRLDEDGRAGRVEIWISGFRRLLSGSS